MAMERKPAGRMQGGGAGLSNLAELVERILDKGIVIDAWVSVSLIGIEVLSVQARVVVASVDTYLKYAEALAQTALTAQPQAAQARQSRVPQDAQVGQSRVQALPSDEQVAGYLSSHPDGAQMTDLEQHFGVPRHELDPIVSRLAEQHRLHRDEEKNRYLSDL